MSKSSGPKQQVADYYMSIHFGVCTGPADAITGIYIGEKEAWTGNVTSNTDLALTKRNLFGGVKKEGGVAGTVAMLFGGITQTLSEALAARLGRTTATCPGFRGKTTLFFTGSPTGGFYWGSNSPYLRPVWIRVSRAPKGITPELAAIPNTGFPADANPACMIYECLTNTDWGMGAPTSIIDVESFEDAAQTMVDEAFGLSMQWVASTEIQNFVTEILDHIQATLFVNPRTGLLTLKLIRNDYNLDDLPVFGPDNCTLTSYQRKLWAETTNEVVVTWTNPQNEEEETVTQQDLGNIQMQGGVVSTSRNYYGVRNSALANRLALRDLRTYASPLASVQIEADRRAWDILPGDCIRLSWPEYGITSMVVRVGSIDYGKIGSGTIRIEGMEDVFALQAAEFEFSGGSLWEDPAKQPEPIEAYKVLTAPLFVLGSSGRISSADDLEFPSTYAMMLAAQPDGMDTIGFALYGERPSTSGPLEYQHITDMHLSGASALPADIDLEVETNVLDFTGDQIGFEGPEVGGLAVIGGPDADQEIAYIREYDTGTGWLLDRGVLDTIPRAWPAGTSVWFINPGTDAIDPTEYSAASSPNWKLLTQTSLGTLEEDDASIINFELTGRPHLPNRPANVQINGDLWGPVTIADDDDPIEVTWAVRNRAQEDAVIRKWTDATMLPEDGQTTKIVIRDTDGNVLATHDGLTGTDFTIPIESFADVSTAIVRVSSERDGFESLQALEIEVRLAEREGYGFNYGYNYGGD